MNVDTILLGVSSLLSLGTLGCVLALGVAYGRDKQILTQAVLDIADTKKNVRTILGNGHPGPFVTHEMHDTTQEEVSRHRTTLHAHGNVLQQHELRLAHIEKEG